MCKLLRERCGRLLLAIVLAPTCLSLPGCTTSGPPPADLDEPIFGSSHATTFIVAPEKGNLHAADLATAARILRRYKTLEEAERALVRSAVGQRLQGLIALEMRRLAPRYQARAEALQRLPDRAEAARRLAELDEAIRKEAAATVVRRLGDLVAVPLETSDNRSAVAYARIGAGTIEVAKDAEEIDRPIASLIEGAPVQATGGRVASLLKSTPVAVLGR